MQSIRSLARKSLPRRLRERLHPPFANLSYSQEGEDRVLSRMLEGTASGFYVDVGAHHPRRFSNTYAFYCKGWRGINIDACPESMEAFRLLRPRDINLEVAISDVRQTLTYFRFNESALNTFCGQLARENDGRNGYKIVDTRQFETRKLGEVLDQYLPPGQMIDFLSVDVEGLDESVLRSNRWDIYRPRFILAEDLALRSLRKAMESPLVAYLDMQGYELVGKTYNTLIFHQR